MFPLSFIQENQTSEEVMLHSSQCILSDIAVFICPTTDDIHLDFLIKVEPERLFHYKATFFPFIVHQYFVGRYFDTM